jgi:hypothetical protein
LITAEHGKVLSDARGEVTRGMEVVEFACGIPQRLKGEFSENGGHERRQLVATATVGICVGITPFNIPAMVADVDVPGRDRLRQYVRAEALGKKDPSWPMPWPNCCARPACRTACSMS